VWKAQLPKLYSCSAHELAHLAAQFLVQPKRTLSSISPELKMPIPDTKLVDDRIRAYLSHVTCRPNYKGFDAEPLAQIDYVSASLSKASTTFKFTVDSSMSNMDGNLHGGAATTIFDNLTSTALFALDRPGAGDYLGVSRSLLVTFLRPLPVGTEVELVCKVVAAGKRLAQLRGAMKTIEGKVCATCIHEKVILNTIKL
jgi:acyl-coenzyme A thioesterase 13